MFIRIAFVFHNMFALYKILYLIHSYFHLASPYNINQKLDLKYLVVTLASEFFTFNTKYKRGNKVAD